MLRLKIMETVPTKARYLWRRALQPNQKDAEWVRLPRRLAAALIRPLRLAFTALRRLIAPP